MDRRRILVEGVSAKAASISERLLILEAGSTQPSWIRSPESAVVVAQPPDEPARDFAARAIDAIRILGGRLRHVVFAAGSATGQEVFDARCRIARAAAASVALRAGSLLFAGHERLGAGVRQELFAIAGVLLEGVADTRLAVAVRFESA